MRHVRDFPSFRMVGLVLLLGVMAGLPGCASKPSGSSTSSFAMADPGSGGGGQTYRTVVASTPGTSNATVSNRGPAMASSRGSGPAMADAGISDAAVTDSPKTTTTDISSAIAGSPDYGIGPGDVLDINVFQVPDLSRKVQVDAGGDVSLPLVGVIKVAGKTTAQAEQEIANKLSQTYLQSPQVSVLVSHSAQRISVNGAVQHPGVLTLTSSLTLSQAVAEAGGPSDVANEGRVHVARLNRDRTVKDSVFDLENIRAGKAPDPTLQSGDIVVVEESGMRVVLKSMRDLLPFGFFFSAIL